MEWNWPKPDFNDKIQLIPTSISQNDIIQNAQNN